jgi:GLPGLI family protein
MVIVKQHYVSPNKINYMQHHHQYVQSCWSNQKQAQFAQLIKAFSLALLILFSTLSFAQKTEGSVRYLMTENYVKEMAAVDYLSKLAVDKLSYMYGSRLEWKTYSTLYFNATQTKYEDSDESAEKDDAGYSWRKDVYTITRNYEKKTMRDAIDLLGKTYIIEDTLRAPKWKILNEMKEIAGHICMNAFWNDTLKKQKVVGWYALDIPNGGGPERFFGLPGLILEVNLNDGAMVITADKIEPKKLTTELDLPKKIKGKKINENDYVEILKKYFAEKRKLEQPPFWYIRY